MGPIAPNDQVQSQITKEPPDVSPLRLNADIQPGKNPIWQPQITPPVNPGIRGSYTNPIPLHTRPRVDQGLTSLREHGTNNAAPPASLGIGSKRDHIDLTTDSDNEVHAKPSKRSRSSSISREKTSHLKQLERTDREYYAPGSLGALNTRSTQAKGITAPLSGPLSTSTQYVSAVVVPPISSGPTPDEKYQREKFLQNLAALEGVSLVNIVDWTSPLTNFKFIAKIAIGKGVTQAPRDVMIGCTCYGVNKTWGCAYLNKCSCMQDAAVKRYAYHAQDIKRGLLVGKYLESLGQYHIYECNAACDCPADCKNRVVQHGRTVKLEIFKTTNRGFGLRCKDNLRKGQFIDTYRGEIITNEEADERGRQLSADSPNYFFALDKFEGADSTYVCDGMYMGGPTRFINHSCDPNCLQFTVSLNHNDLNIYELAFFAKEDIQAGTELTFDYGSSDKVTGDEDDGTGHFITDEEADEHEKVNGYRPQKCLCGATRCRNYYFQ